MKNNTRIILVGVVALLVVAAILSHVFKPDSANNAQAVSVEQQTGTSTEIVFVEEDVSTNAKLEESNAPTQENKEVVLTKEDQVRILKDKLRNATLGGMRRPQPMRVCDTSTEVIIENGEEKIVEVEVQYGLSFTFSLADGTHDDDVLEIYATDSEGGVAGHLPYPGSEEITVFDSFSHYWKTRGYGGLRLLKLDEYIDGNIRIRNIDSEGHFFSFYISDLLGNCDLTSQIMLGMGTSTTVMIPVSKAGDLGPIEWDFESDGIVDMYESLVFELSKEQLRLKQDIIALTYPDEALEECIKYSEWTAPPEYEHLLGGMIVMKEWCAERGL